MIKVDDCQIVVHKEEVIVNTLEHGVIHFNWKVSSEDLERIKMSGIKTMNGLKD